MAETNDSLEKAIMNLVSCIQGLDDFDSYLTEYSNKKAQATKRKLHQSINRPMAAINQTEYQLLRNGATSTSTNLAIANGGAFLGSVIGAIGTLWSIETPHRTTAETVVTVILVSTPVISLIACIFFASVSRGQRKDKALKSLTDRLRKDLDIKYHD